MLFIPNKIIQEGFFLNLKVQMSKLIRKIIFSFWRGCLFFLIEGIFFIDDNAVKKILISFWYFKKNKYNRFYE